MLQIGETLAVVPEKYISVNIRQCLPNVFTTWPTEYEIFVLANGRGCLCIEVVSLGVQPLQASSTPVTHHGSPHAGERVRPRRCRPHYRRKIPDLFYIHIQVWLQSHWEMSVPENSCSPTYFKLFSLTTSWFRITNRYCSIHVIRISCSKKKDRRTQSTYEAAEIDSFKEFSKIPFIATSANT